MNSDPSLRVEPLSEPMTQQPPDREAIAQTLRSFHRNACYPEAMPEEIEMWVDRILSSFPVGVGQTRPQIESLPANESANAKSEILDER